MVVLWDSLPPASEEAPLYGASACEFADSIYVFGGWSQDPGAPAHEIRHCVFDLNTQTWLKQEALDIDGEVPSPRAGSSVTRIRGSIYLFGGQELWPSGFLDDFYLGSILQEGVVSWSRLNVQAAGDSTSRRPSMHSEVGSAVGDGTESVDDEASVKSGEEVAEATPKPRIDSRKVSRPPRRAWHASCTLENEDGLSVVVICGGISGVKEEGGLCEDLWSYDPESDHWSNHTPQRKRKSKKAAIGRSPLPRAYHTLTRVGKGTEAVLFGGRTLLGESSNDVFVLNSLAWTWSQLATTIPQSPRPPTIPKGDSFNGSVNGNSFNSFEIGTTRSFVPCPGPLGTAWHSASSVLMPVEMLEVGYSEEEVEKISFYDLDDSDDENHDDNSHHHSVSGNSVRSNTDSVAKGSTSKPSRLWRQAKGASPSKAEVLLIFGGISAPPPIDFNDTASVTSASSSVAPSTVVPQAHGAPLYALDRMNRWHLIEALDCRKEAGPNPVKGGPSARSGAVLVASEDKDKVVLVGGSSCPSSEGNNTIGGTGVAAALAMKSNRSTAGAKKMDRFGDAMVLRLFAPQPSSSDTAEDELNAGPVRNTKSRKSNKKKGPQTVKLNLDDGGTYEGFIDAKGLKNGHGRRVYGPSGPDSGDVYEGDFEEDVREGVGQCKHFDGRVYQGNWSGDEPSGMGTMTYPTHNSTDCRVPVQYHGLWRRGLRHGSGVLTLRDGSELESNWRNGKLKADAAKLTTFSLHPITKVKVPFAVTSNIRFDEQEHVVEGTETHVGGVGGGREEYMGSFNLKGERHAEHGVCIYSDGSVYRGSWRNGRRNGRGTMEDSRTKELYDGKWVGGERLGKGLCTYPAGHRYDGTWANGLRDGVGTFFKANGESYHGEFKAGVRHGYGVRTDARGRVLRGWWKNDELAEEDLKEEKPKMFEDDDLTSLGAPSVSSLVSYDFNADVAISIESVCAACMYDKRHA